MSNFLSPASPVLPEPLPSSWSSSSSSVSSPSETVAGDGRDSTPFERVPLSWSFCNTGMSNVLPNGESCDATTEEAGPAVREPIRDILDTEAAAAVAVTAMDAEGPEANEENGNGGADESSGLEVWSPSIETFSMFVTDEIMCRFGPGSCAVIYSGRSRFLTSSSSTEASRSPSLPDESFEWFGVPRWAPRLSASSPKPQLPWGSDLKSTWSESEWMIDCNPA
mmetsp:Transcript_16825/g.34793  ORF Transcript_16825/g.34793 Transcript_16825/m.34793 type:complete len:223 (-) Transcript_16825:2409-3077(-)